MRPAVVIAIALTVAGPLALAHAGPPIEDSSSGAGIEPAPIPDPDPDPPFDAEPQAEPAEPGSAAMIWDDPGGFWLSLELIGPRGAQIDAARALVQPPVIDALPRGGAPPPGELVGRVDTLEQALRWVDTHSFAPLGEGEAATPVPGGRLYTEHGLFLTALVVTGGSLAGTQVYPWPPAAVLPIPEGVRWQPASLAVARAPMFAAPAPTLPPASERYQIVTLDDAVWLLDTVDHCRSDDDGVCLRWAQILVRRGDRFFGGWVPATHVIPDSAWVGGPGERRYALLPGHRTRAKAGFALIEQRGDRREGPVGLGHAHVGADWPSAVVEVLGEELVVLIGNEPALTQHISADPPLQ